MSRRFWHFLLQFIIPLHPFTISTCMIKKYEAAPDTRFQLAALQEKEIQGEMLQVTFEVWAVKQSNPQITVPSISWRTAPLALLPERILFSTYTHTYTIEKKGCGQLHESIPKTIRHLRHMARTCPSRRIHVLFSSGTWMLSACCCPIGTIPIHNFPHALCTYRIMPHRAQQDTVEKSTMTTTIAPGTS